MIPSRINDMLSSGDIEMVRLGVAWVENILPQEEWREVLDLYTIMWPRWNYSITDNTITVFDFYNGHLPKGIWEQLDSDYKHTYRIDNFKLTI